MIATEYLKRMSDGELREALLHRRRMAAVYRDTVNRNQAWADHHEEVARAIEAEMAERGARAPTDLPA